MINISVIIVSYNAKSFLRRTLSSLFTEVSSSTLKIEVIVVDNASLDGSYLMVADEFPNVKIINNKKNLGFSKANNIGIKKSEGKFLLFLNPDIEFPQQENNVFDYMVSFMEEKKNTGAATCKVNLINGKLDDSCHRGFPTPWRSFSKFAGLSKIFFRSKLFNGYNLGWMDFDKNHEVESCAGSFMIVRKEAGEQIGWWDEDFFWYGEDLDFCFRLKEKGWKIFFVPQVYVIHYKGVSGGIKEISKDLTTANRETKILATNARFDAMKIFYDKHYKNKYPKILTWLILSLINLKRQFALQNL